MQLAPLLLHAGPSAYPRSECNHALPALRAPESMTDVLGFLLVAFGLTGAALLVMVLGHLLDWWIRRQFEVIFPPPLFAVRERVMERERR